MSSSSRPPPPAHSLPAPSGPLAEDTYSSRDSFMHLMLGLIATLEQVTNRLPSMEPGNWSPDPASDSDRDPDPRAADDRTEPLLR